MTGTAESGRSGRPRPGASLRKLWEANAPGWIKMARESDPFYWKFGRRHLLRLLPPPGRLTVDVGCGEGRLPRELRSMGHRVVGVEHSLTMLREAARTEAGGYIAADAARLPLRDSCADLAVAYNSLQDVDDVESAVREVGRVLVAGGRFCFSIVHPINSAGEFPERAADDPFVIRGAYLSRFRHTELIERDGFSVTLHGLHRPLEDYARALEAAGLLIEAIREPPADEELVAERPWAAHWRRLPCFLFVRAVKR